MDTYRFALNINDLDASLTPENGLEFGTLGTLINHLSKAITPKGDVKCTLYDIKNHGYTPHFITSNKNLYNNFIDVHKNLYEREITELNKEEAVYANTLKKVLSKNKYVEPLDNELKPFLRLSDKEIEKGVVNYNVITNKSGIISEIGSPKLEETRHVYLHGIDYKIFITPVQEELLKKYYRQGEVDLKLKQKRSLSTDRVISAQLISFTIKSTLTLSDSLSSSTEEELSSIGSFNSVEDILTLLRS